MLSLVIKFENQQISVTITYKYMNTKFLTFMDHKSFIEVNF